MKHDILTHRLRQWALLVAHEGKPQLSYDLLEAALVISAQADTHPKGGDCSQAPAPLSGTVPVRGCAQAIAQTIPPNDKDTEQ